MRVSPIRLAAQISAALAAVAAITFICSRIPAANATTVAVIYLLAILAAAARFGSVEAVAASLLAVLCLNYFFLPPVGTFTIADPANWAALFAFLVTSIVAGQLSARARQRAEEALQGRQEMERLYELSRALLLAGSGTPAAAALAQHVVRIFECDPVAFHDRESGAVYHAGTRPPALADSRLITSALEGTVFHEGGAMTIPVRLGGRCVGSLSVPDGAVSEAALNAIVSLAAVAVERERALAVATEAEASRRHQELKSTLLDAVAHEFKTPLTSIKAAATALLASGSSQPGERELLTIVDEETERLNEMVTEAIQVARIESGKVQLALRPVSMQSLVSNVLKWSASMLESRQVTVNIPPGLPKALADPELIAIALRQLLNNAVKYSPAGSALVVSARLEAGSVVLSVKDLGAGIPQDEQERIFERFFRGQKASGLAAGSGMGLPIAREIVTTHQGKLWVESQPGQGSTFSFSLPIAPAEEAA